jgi:P-type E1-E2 ATPase
MAGVPDVVHVESVAGLATSEIMKLAASAEAGSSHPVGRAILRATDAPRVALRTVMVHPGLGVTAQAPSGDRLVVGNRTLCMRESVSVAVAEERIAELERKGRIVVLVAVGGRLVGWVALQDELAPGARACVEQLVAARVEPVLLTGAARATAEALAAALGVEHMRPEVAPDDRGAEVRALATSGAFVAAIGSPKTDDGALGAAGVSVALGAAGAPAGEWTITVATQRADAAAAAMVLARDARDRVRSVVVPGILPGMLAALGVATSLVPADYAFFAPLVGAVGTVISWRLARVDS